MVRILILTLIISLGINGFFVFQNFQNQIVVSVPDGDSIQLHDGRRIRLLGIDAPEKERCGAEEARQRLIELVEGIHVRLEDIVTDNYGRQLANVYADGQLINEQMVQNGYAMYTSVASKESGQMKSAYEQARAKKLGIFSETCRPTVSADGCTIKANIKNGNRTYHLPGCKNYDQTIIDLAYGDQWFCSEEEAQEAGFEKAGGC